MSVYQFQAPDLPTVTVDICTRTITRHVCGGPSVEHYQSLTGLQSRMDGLENRYGLPKRILTQEDSACDS